MLAFEVALVLLAVDHERQRQDVQAEVVYHLFDEVAAGIGDDLELHVGLPCALFRPPRASVHGGQAASFIPGPLRGPLMSHFESILFSTGHACHNFEKSPGPCGKRKGIRYTIPV